MSNFIRVENVNGIISYRSGLFVYEEGFRSGRLEALSYNSSGFMMGANPRAAYYFDTSRTVRPQSFILSADGQELCSDWEYLGVNTIETETGTQATVSLKHLIRPISINIVTELDGTSIMNRRIEVVNTSDKPCAVSEIKPLSGIAFQLRGDATKIRATGNPFRLGYMKSAQSCDEGDFRWRDLPDEPISICGRFVRGRHRHPMFLLESRQTGDMMIAQFAYSGGYKFDFDLNMENKNTATLSMTIGQDAPAPVIVIPPMGKYASPEVHIGVVHGDLDAAVNAMHAHLRKSVLQKPLNGITGYIETGIGPEYNMDIVSTLKALEYAHKIGSDLFFIDAGWYLKPGQEDAWWVNCGDWTPNDLRYPRGIEEIRDKAHSYGIKFGLWMDSERIGTNSHVYRAHPNWVSREYDGSENRSGLLDMANPDVTDWVENQIDKLISKYELDFFRLDYNVDPMAYLNKTYRDGYVENTQARYYENVYGMYKRLKEKYPDVIFENCAGGGARTDIGMLKNFTHTWVTDWQIHPNSFRITNGMTIALPPEYVDRLIGGQQAFITGGIETQMRNLMFGRPSVGIFTQPDVDINPIQLAAVKKYVDFYRSFVRPMHETGSVYHHTPELPGDTASGIGVLEMADKRRGMIGVFNLDGENRTITVYPKGVKANIDYTLTYDSAGVTTYARGFDLINSGVRVNVNSALESELISYEAISK